MFIWFVVLVSIISFFFVVTNGFLICKSAYISFLLPLCYDGYFNELCIALQ